jgi:pheromone shutdown-related protein TraB
MCRANVIERVGNGITLVGTAHISAQSVTDVEAAIRDAKPNKVLVELDAARLRALQDPDAWRKTDIFRILREKKQHLFLLQLYLAAVQAQMGRGTGVQPGAEMLRAVQVAEEVGAEVVLIDRDVAITLRRGFSSMGFFSKLRLFWKVWMRLFTPGDADLPVDVDRLLKTDAITEMTEEFARFAPQVKIALIDERDDFMASHIREQATKGSVVAVVGAGHVPGIRRRLGASELLPDRAALLELPRRRLTVGKVVAFGLPLIVLAAFAYLALNANYRCLGQLAMVWWGLHAALAGLGAALALGHPLSILTAAIAAPIFSLVPLFKSGWLAGLVQAYVRKPTVEDFEAIRHVETLRQFWTNGVVRVLLVASLSILGSLAATWISLYIFFVQRCS